jgi:DNA replication protein DnaC
MGTIRDGLLPIIRELEKKHGAMPTWSQAGPAPPSERTCVTCGDQGFVYRNVPFGDPNFGRAVPCPACEGAESLADRAARLWRLSGIGGVERERCTFARFDLAANPTLGPAFQAAQTWALGDGLPWLVLAGPEGRGKTHLAIAAAHVCIARGIAVAYHVVPLWLDALRATQRPPLDSEPAPPLDRVRHKAERYPAVILDDLGADRDTDFAREQLYLVLNERWRERRRTLITTNEPVEHFAGRLASRLLDRSLAHAIGCEGLDYRRTAATS